MRRDVRWCPTCQHRYEAQDRERRGTSTERGYDYHWRTYRLLYLRTHPLCATCSAAGRVEAATVVDHIVAHKGDQALFWDRGNHRAMCKPCHDRRVDEGDFGR